MAAILAISAALQFLAAFLSVRFVYHRRLGRPWLLVSVALIILGGLRLSTLFAGYYDPDQAILDSGIETISLLVALLLVCGFALTERWFLLKERLEGRFMLLSEVDRSLVGILDENRIMSVVCEVLCRQKGYRLAWIGSGEPDGSVRIVKSAGKGEAFLFEAGIRWDDTPKGQGVTGTALRTGKPCVVNRVDADPGMAEWKSALSEGGIHRAVSVRIESGGQPALALTVYADSRSAFSGLEIEGFLALAYRVGQAIQSARRHEFFVAAKSAYDDLLRTQRDGVILVRGGRIVRVNPSASSMLAYPDGEELVGADPAIILKEPEACPEHSGVLRCGTGEGGRFKGEAEIARKDGSVFFGELAVTWLARTNRKSNFFPKYDGPLGMIILRDITGRKLVLEDLRRQRDFSEKMLDIAGVLIAQMNPRGEIVLINRQFEEMTGYAWSQVSGQEMAGLLISGSCRAAYRRNFDRIVEGEVSQNVEFPLVTTAGEERLVVWNHALLRNPEGNAISVVATGTDVTESRRLERQIIQMQKMEAVGTLAGGIAHDFNNILTGIMGNLDLAAKVVPPESLAAIPVQESIKASERAANMVRQLLDFSRRSPSERRAIDLGKVGREVADLVAQTIDRRIEMDICAADGLWLAMADPNQAHQVLMNLCVNARDAIMERAEGKQSGEPPDGGYRIRIVTSNFTVGDEYCRQYPYARKGDYVVVSISDNGAGMDEATQRRVFEPFFTTKKLGRGTGLGLSTVYGIVKQHEGWVNLESRPGKGTTFHAYLPRAEAGAEEEKSRAGEVAREKMGKETILLVDDEEMIRTLGRQVLEVHGYSVLVAADGQEAADLYSAHRDRIDLTILDLSMPYLSGSEVLERIRGMNPGAKVIMSSGHPSRETSRASAFLPKPYRADKLTRIVRDVLDRSS
ncbi:MAG: PAS domain S-box protein [Deltaproteobacteria bacterium]|nr:PAS domain S-box protein [Deltaproteobacteria bacterium]